MKNSNKRNRTSILAAVAVASLSVGCASTRIGQATAAAQTFRASEQVQAATAVLRRYEAALNRGDVGAIVSLYAPDAVFMAQNRSPAVGQELLDDPAARMRP